MQIFSPSSSKMNNGSAPVSLTPTSTSDLLFFDTFSHEASEELNLDLVQFPSPVIVQEVRVIPLGARVQANFAGGVRLGATNPTAFRLEFFVNDLGRPGASAFESLGTLVYDQHQKIHLNAEKAIPTDGLVLRGMYTAITLAVYGTLSKSTAEQLASEASATEQRNSHSEPTPPKRESEESSASQRGQWNAEQRSESSSAKVSSSWNNESHSNRSSWNSSDHHQGERSNHRSSSEYRDVNGSERHHSRSKSPGSDFGRGISPGSGSGGQYYRPRSRTPASADQHRRSSSLEAKPPPSPPPDDKIFDEMSDISDGDIPDLPEEDDFGGKESKVVIKKESVEEEKKEEEVDDKSKMDEEDMEEISDDEFIDEEFGTDLFEFGEDLEDPVRSFNVYTPDLGGVEGTKTPDLEEETLNDIKNKLRTLVKSNEYNSDWINLLEETSEILSKSTGAVDDDELNSLFLEVTSSALSVSQALTQSVPTDKVRHLKSGLVFVNEEIKFSKFATDQLLDAGLQQFLCQIASDKIMAPSLKLLALQTLSLTVERTLGMDTFLGRRKCSKSLFKCETLTNNSPSSLYEIVLNLVATTGSRIKHVLAALLAKLHFYQLAVSLRDSMKDYLDMDISNKNENGIVELLEEISIAMKNGSRTFKLPEHLKHFTGQSEFQEGLFHALNMTHYLDSLYVLMTQMDKASPKLRSVVLESLTNLSLWHKGAVLMCKHTDVSNRLIRILIQLQDSLEDDVNPLIANLSISSHAYQTVQKLRNLITIRETFSGPDDDRHFELLEQLQILYSMNFVTLGRKVLNRILEEESCFDMLVNLALEDNDKCNIHKTSSAIAGFACELVMLTIRTSDSVKHMVSSFSSLNELIEKTSKFNSKVSTELESLMKPIQTRDNTDKIVALIKKNSENVAPLAPEILVSVRILAELCQNWSGTFGSQMRISSIAEMHSQGIVDLYIEILERICVAHKQPSLHTATFCGESGFRVLSAVKSIMRTLAMIGERVIESRPDFDFKDQKLINVVLKTYNLTSAVPAASICYPPSLEIASDVLRLLACCTRPNFAKDQVNEIDSKSSWILMLSEVLDFAMDLPHSFGSGCKLLSELLPLPLPMPRSFSEAEMISEEEKSYLFNMRKLWSVHLIHLHTKLRHFIKQMTGVNDNTVLHWLRKICIQISDLSYPTSQMICQELLQGNGKNSLSVLASIAQTPSIRTSLIHMLSEEKDQDYTTLTSWTDVLLNSSDINRQHSILEIFASLCEPKLSLSDDKKHFVSPPALILEKIVMASLNYLSKIKKSRLNNLQSALRVLIVLGERKEGQYHLWSNISNCPNFLESVFQEILEREDCKEAFHPIVEFTNSLMHPQFGSPKLEKITQSNLFHLLKHSCASEIFNKVKDKIISGKEEDSTSNIDKLVEDLESILNFMKDYSTEVNEYVFSDYPRTDDSEYNYGEQFESRVCQIKGEEKNVSTFLEISPYIDESTDLKIDLMDIGENSFQNFNLIDQVKLVCEEKGLESETNKKKSILERKVLHNKALISTFRAHGTVAAVRGRGGGVGMGFPRGGGMMGGGNHHHHHHHHHQRGDGFRSRAPNTSRPPSLHVDDFLLLQQRGQQPTGPTGYNKQSIKAAQELFAQREAAAAAQQGSIVGFREATKMPVYDKTPGMPNAIRSRGPSREKSMGYMRGIGPPRSGPGGRERPRGWSPMSQEMADRRKWLNERRGIKDRRTRGGDDRIRHMRNMTR